MKNIFKIVSLGLLGIALFSGCLPVSEDEKLEVDEFIAHMQSAVPEMLYYYEIPGAEVALISGGEVVWSQGFGTAEIETNRPVEPDTLFQAASISKPFTAWAVMKLVEEGKMDLDAPIETYLKRWHLPESEFDHDQVTIRRLLTHSAGLSIARYKGLPPDAEVPPLDVAFQQMTEAGTGIFVENTPGKEFRYSDSNFLLLMMAIEDLTGEPFEKFMQREIIEPLGLAQSSFSWDASRLPDTAVGYDSLFIPYNEYLYAQKASAGLYTTAYDLAKFVTANMTGEFGELPGRGILQPDTVETMTNYQQDIQGWDSWIYSDAYGYGYFVEYLPSGQLVYSHMGGNPGWLSEFAAMPESGDGIVVLSNVTHGHELFADVLAEWTDWLGVGRVRVAGTILFARYIFDMISTGLSVLGLFLISPLLAGFAFGKRRICLDSRCMPWWRNLLLVILPVFGLAAWWAFGYPALQVSLPSQRDWMSVGLTILLAAMLLRGISIRKV